MHEKTAHKNGPSHKTVRQGRAEQDPQPDLCKIYEILTIFIAKKLCLWYTVSDKRTAFAFCVIHIKRKKIMKTIYILLTRSGTLLSNLVYAVTGANYTHASLAFDEDLSCLYSSTRKNGYTMFPAGPSREYLNRGVFRLRENVPCALYALDVSDEAYTRARRRAEHMMAHGNLYRFNVIGLALCGLHIRWNRRRHYFCSQFVSEVLEKSGAMELPKHSTLMHPNDYTRLEELRCVYRGTLAGLPQRQQMEFDQNDTVVGVYLGLALGLFHTGAARVRAIF